jgi:hypothetical protein
MKNQFVTHEQALELRDLDFKEPCIARFIGKQFSTNTLANWYDHNSGEISNKMLAAPLKQQVFDWIRKKYKYYFWIEPCSQHKFFHFTISCSPSSFEYWTIDDTKPNSGALSSYSEAEDEMLNKLIEIVKKYDVRES